MRRTLLFTATTALLLGTSNTLHAQDVRELSETVKRLQLQVSALEARIVELSALPPQMLKAQSAISQLETRTTGMATSLNELGTKTTAFATGLNELQVRLKGLTLSSGNYVLNAGTGSVLIRAASLTLESTGATNITAGTTASVTVGSTMNMSVGSTMNMSVGSNLAIISGSALSLKGAASSTLESPGSLTLTAGTSGVLDAGNDWLLRSRILNLTGHTNVLLKAPRGAFNFDGTLDIRGSRVNIAHAIINGN